MIKPPTQYTMEHDPNNKNCRINQKEMAESFGDMICTCRPVSNPTEGEWEEGLHNLICDAPQNSTISCLTNEEVDILKSFIHRTLSSQRATLRSHIEEIINKNPKLYNQAIEDVLKLL